MSRRVQFFTAEYKGSKDAPVSYRQPIFAAYTPGGKVEMEHDPEDLLLAFADLLTNGSATARHPYVINGCSTKPRRFAVEILHGWKPTERIHDRIVPGSKVIFFDACEVIERGEVWWKVDTAKTKQGSIPWTVKTGGLYTRGEILRIAANCLFS